MKYVSINIYKIIVFFIIVYFLFSKVVDMYFPFGKGIMQSLLLLISLFLVLKDINITIKTRIVYIVYAFLAVFILTLLFTEESLKITSGFINYTAFLFCPILAWPCVKVKNIYKILLFCGLLNSLALILEVFFRIRFVKPDTGYEAMTVFSVTNHLGLFGDPKSGGFFLFFIGCIAFLENRNFLFLFFLSITLLTGVRTATVFLLVPGIVMIIKLRLINKVIMIVFLILIMYVCYLYLVNTGLLDRLLGVLSVATDEGNQVRVRMMLKHLLIYKNYSFGNLLFGNVGFARSIVGNGAENAMIEILTNTGLFGFTIFTFPLFFYLLRFIKEKKLCSIVIFSLFCAMGVGRIMLGFSGIIVWIILFREIIPSFNNNKKIYAINTRN